ncbi:unnamed protein product, partial [Rotaria sp. Silwood1]
MFVPTDLNDKYLHGGTDQHCHEPNPEIIEARQVSAKDKRTNPTTLAVLPTSQEIYPSVAKARQKKTPSLPQSCLFDLPDHFKTTIDGNRFILCDESLARRERILVFASDRQLDLLFASPIIYMDGTFAKSSPHFTQYILYMQFFLIYFMALALMPREHVVSSFREIQADADRLPHGLMEDLLIYFETNWLDDIDLWNVSTSENRTNN